MNNINFEIEKSLDYFKKGEFKTALKILKKLKNNNNFLVNWYLSNTYFKLHKYNSALIELKESIHKKSKDVLNLNFLGEIYLEIGEYKKAHELFEEALKLNQNNKSTLINLAKINLIKGNDKESKKNFQKLLEIDPENYSYYYSLIRIEPNYLSDKLINKIKNNNK